MKEKEIVTSGKITSELLGGYLLFGIIFGVMYNIIMYIFKASLNISTVTLMMDSIIIITIVSLLLNLILAFLTCFFSTTATFKKRTLRKDDVSKVVRNISIVIIILILITVYTNYINTQNLVNLLNSANEFNSLSGLLDQTQTTYTDSSILYTSLLISEIGSVITYVGIILFQRKLILNRAE